MSWYSSWIPGLPNFNFAIPAGIQGRFISFVLKKSLGHLLKPGQLDYRQIDSQIGSGYVQVNDLEFNAETINEYLRGMPLSLQDGTISSVKARIPWPNPLASTLGFSLKSLHLNFLVAPVGEYEQGEEPDLADSVASMAESFVHEQLSSKDDANLWQSFHQELTVDESNSLPGGLDTFSPINPDALQSDMEPAGVSVFAGLIERLLARFEFDAQDIKITLIHPGNMSLTLSLQDIQYLTNAQNGSNSSSLNSATQGENRTLTVDGVSLLSRNLSPRLNPVSSSGSANSIHSSSSTETSRPLSRTSSSSSMDEEARFAMSRSLAVLPPRTKSPSSSVSSSMYESAISTTSSTLPISNDNTEIPGITTSEGVFEGVSELPEDIIMSFGSQSLVFQIRTSSSTPQIPDDDPFVSSANSTPSSGDELNIRLSAGIIACAIKPWHIQGLSQLVHEVLPPGEPTIAPPSRKPSLRTVPPIKANAEIRALVVLLVSPLTISNPLEQAMMADFFNRPLVPPPLDNGYTRIYLDSLSSSLLLVHELPHDDTGSSGPSLSEAEFGLADISIFFFSKIPVGQPSASLTVFPLLITDPHLPAQYSVLTHVPNTQPYPPLPTFPVIDWVQEASESFGARLSQWRCQVPKGNVPNHPKSPFATEADKSGPMTSSKFALRIGKKQSSTITDGLIKVNDDLDIEIAPLHIRLDLGYILQPTGPLAFYEDLCLIEKPIDDVTSISPHKISDKAVTDPSQTTKAGREENRSPKKLSRHSRSNVNFSFIRLSVRCPPPTHISNRSGTLIFDFRDTNLAMHARITTPTTRFAQRGSSPQPDSDASQGTVLFDIIFNRIILAYSLVGTTTAASILSIGPLAEDHHTQFMDTEAPPLKPRICIMKPKLGISKMAPGLALSIDLPCVQSSLDKVYFDALQYWADDVSQLLERISVCEAETELNDSRNPSMIGSRFLAKSRNSSALGGSPNDGAEIVIKVSITETFAYIMVPRTDSAEFAMRPLCVQVSDLDVLIEFDPENKQQTILTVGIMNLIIDNTPSKGDPQRFLGLTSPRSLSTSAASMVKLRLSTVTVPETGNKETRIKLTMCGFTYTFYPDMHWVADLAAFSKNPPGTFESVIPSDRTRISVKISNGSVRVLAPLHPGAIVSHIQDLEFSTDVVGDSRDSAFRILATSATLLAIDDARQENSHSEGNSSHRGVSAWTGAGYALLAEFVELDTNVINQLSASPMWKVLVDRIVLRLHLCADTLTAVTTFSEDLGTLFNDTDKKPQSSAKRPVVVDEPTIMSSVEDLAFKRMPEVGPAPDMIFDDLPTNLDYLDESFGAAAGLRELVDEDLDQFSDSEVDIQTSFDDPHIVSRIGGETIKVFDAKGLDVVEDYYTSIPPDNSKGISHSSDAIVSVRILDGTINLFLYDGYDWATTRKTIEEQVKEMRKRLAKIRQLVASGQVQEPIIEDTSTLLFNSLHIGLEQDEDALEEPSALIAAIDEELQDDLETASQSSWQSLRTPSSNKARTRSTRVHGKRLTRSRTPSIEFSLQGLYTEFDQFASDDPLVSRTFITVKDLEILDHIKTSTWKKFLTDLRSDSRGNVRETESNMVRIELQGVRPVSGNSAEEVRLRAKILPLRLYVDQDAVDFLKKFFSFKDPNSAHTSDESSNEGDAFIQMGEIFPIDLKLDYKPRRVDYRALKEGRTIELMNFFHFDGAEMTLRHITLAGVTGWPRFFEMLNDLWTPDVKATQLVEVISGVAPIRSMVNVGSGVADLILLPIAQYKKDGRIVRGVQKGATAFVKSTAIEAIKMGAKLATGTQVILEQAEGILGGQFEVPVTAEPVQVPYGDDVGPDDEEDEGTADLISKYAQQPVDLREGVQSAYKSLQRNLNSAAQTILAVPMEVYERSGNEGPVRSVIRAVPIAVLKPMIGASEAVSKTLLGLHNTLDPNIRHDNEAKYKLR